MYDGSGSARTGTVALRDGDALETVFVSSSVSASAFLGFRVPREVISVAVRWYLHYGVSYRDVEELSEPSRIASEPSRIAIIRFSR